MSFEGGAFNFVENIQKAGDDFNGDNGTDKGRFAETTRYLEQTNADLGHKVTEAQRSQEQHGHPGVEGGHGGLERLSAAERSPGTARERAPEQRAEQEAEVAALDEAIMGLDPMPSAPSGRAETRAETATA